MLFSLILAFYLMILLDFIATCILLGIGLVIGIFYFSKAINAQFLNKLGFIALGMIRPAPEVPNMASTKQKLKNFWKDTLKSAVKREKMDLNKELQDKLKESLDNMVTYYREYTSEGKKKWDVCPARDELLQADPSGASQSIINASKEPKKVIITDFKDFSQDEKKNTIKRLCPNCGFELPLYWNSCPQCGHDFDPSLIKPKLQTKAVDTNSPTESNSSNLEESKTIMIEKIEDTKIHSEKKILPESAIELKCPLEFTECIKNGCGFWKEEHCTGEK
jgi:hypothetical protein